MLVGFACFRVAAANVRVDNFHSRHLLHSEHDRYFEQLASAPAQEDGVWHYNDAGAPLVNRESIVKARKMEMADDAEADAVRSCVCCLVIRPCRGNSVAPVGRRSRARELACLRGGFSPVRPRPLTGTDVRSACVQAAKAAKKAAEFEEHKAINAEVVARITAPYRYARMRHGGALRTALCVRAFRLA